MHSSKISGEPTPAALVDKGTGTCAINFISHAARRKRNVCSSFIYCFVFVAVVHGRRATQRAGVRQAGYVLPSRDKVDKKRLFQTEVLDFFLDKQRQVDSPGVYT